MAPGNKFICRLKDLNKLALPREVSRLAERRINDSDCGMSELKIELRVNAQASFANNENMFR